ncbi:unnamed protein product [Orchesella dallaii]|uniref:Uncharacterized protein n=1 Tax=Orchesella dallaii TaxID=48710 RepID=A0ABP1RF39_9HEXA
MDWLIRSGVSIIDFLRSTGLKYSVPIYAICFALAVAKTLFYAWTPLEQDEGRQRLPIPRQARERDEPEVPNEQPADEPEVPNEQPADEPEVPNVRPAIVPEIQNGRFPGLLPINVRVEREQNNDQQNIILRIRIGQPIVRIERLPVINIEAEGPRNRIVPPPQPPPLLRRSMRQRRRPIRYGFE